MAKIDVTVLGETKTITYPDALEGQFVEMAAAAFGYPAYVSNPDAAADPTQPPMVENPKDKLQHVMEKVTDELLARVKNHLINVERQKADVTIRAAVDGQIGKVTVG